MNRSKSPVTTALLARRARALKRHLSAALGGDVKGLHQARVASRRLREAVPVLASGVKGSKAGKTTRKVRRLTRALGSVRELDVTMALLDELAARETLPRLPLEDVRARVVAEREHRREGMLKRLQHVKLRSLDRRLSSVATAVGDAGSERWREALASRLVARARALGQAIDAAGQMYEPERLHQVRIAAKKLRYSLELAVDSGVRAAAADVRVIKRVQDTLGRLHDLQVLQSHVAAVQASPSRRTPPDAGFDAIARTLEDECRHLHAHYLKDVPKVTAIVGSTRTTIVPVLAQQTVPAAKAVKMSLDSRSGRHRDAPGAPAASNGRA